MVVHQVDEAIATSGWRWVVGLNWHMGFTSAISTEQHANSQKHLSKGHAECREDGGWR